MDDPARPRIIVYLSKMESLAVSIWLVANYVDFTARTRTVDNVRQVAFYCNLTDAEHGALSRHVTEMINRLDFLTFTPTGRPS